MDEPIITPKTEPEPPAPIYTATRISDIPEGERPRERFREVGATGMTQRELLAILLRVGVQGQGVLALADDLLKRFGGLSGLARTNLHDLETVKGIGKVKAVEIMAAMELGVRLVRESPDQQRKQVKTPTDAAEVFMTDMGVLEQEEVRVMLLDRRNRVLAVQMVYRGSANAIGVRMAEIFKMAIRQNAQSIIVAHNHPSGDATPSGEDVQMTRSLIQSGKLLDIDVLDHLVIAQRSFVSMKERGLGFNE
jgi:DNA repair protein RadC